MQEGGAYEQDNYNCLPIAFYWPLKCIKLSFVPKEYKTFKSNRLTLLTNLIYYHNWYYSNSLYVSEDGKSTYLCHFLDSTRSTRLRTPGKNFSSLFTLWITRCLENNWNCYQFSLIFCKRMSHIVGSVLVCLMLAFLNKD